MISSGSSKNHHHAPWSSGANARLNSSPPPPPPPPPAGSSVAGCVCDESEDDPDGLVMHDEIISMRAATPGQGTQRILNDDSDRGGDMDDPPTTVLNRSTSALSHYPGGTPGPNRAIVDVECYTRGPAGRSTYLVDHLPPLNGGIDHSASKGSMRNVSTMQQGKAMIENDVRPQYNCMNS